nr:hypothetical protein [Tanacetum cinerariifolium]
MSEEILQAKENLMKSIQTFLKKFNRISFREMPKVLSQAWEKFFEIQHTQPEDTNELLQKLLEDLQIIKYLENSSNAIAPVLPTKEPEYSLSIGDEHLSTISETKSNKVIKSSVKNLVSIPSESEVTFDNESKCDVPVKDESFPIFTSFSNPLFDYNDDFTSSDDESLFNKDVPMENFKIYSNPLFDDEEINSNKIDPHYFNAESNLIESFPNRDTLFDSSPKFDYLEEFSEETDLFLDMDDLMPSGIESDDYDSKGDIYFLEELLRNDSLPLSENESSSFDHHDDPSFPRPPSKPPDVEIFFEPDSGFLTTNVVKVNKDKVLNPEIPSGEIKVQIEVLSVLWGNGLPIRTVRCRFLGGGWTNGRVTRVIRVAGQKGLLVQGFGRYMWHKVIGGSGIYICQRWKLRE